MSHDNYFRICAIFLFFHIGASFSYIKMSHQIPKVCKDEHKTKDPINKTTLRVTKFS